MILRVFPYAYLPWIYLLWQMFDILPFFKSCLLLTCKVSHISANPPFVRYELCKYSLTIYGKGWVYRIGNQGNLSSSRMKRVSIPKACPLSLWAITDSLDGHYTRGHKDAPSSWSSVSLVHQLSLVHQSSLVHQLSSSFLHPTKFHSNLCSSHWDHQWEPHSPAPLLHRPLFIEHSSISWRHTLSATWFP